MSNFQTTEMQTAIVNLHQAEKELRNAQDNLQFHCSHQFEDGRSARLATLDSDVCRICRMNL